MSFLPEVAKRLRKPLREGRGIKVFRIEEDVAVGTRVKLKSGRTGKVERKLTHFSDETPFYKVKVAGQKSPSLLKQHEFEIIKEGWGPEDILQDMMEDEGIRRLVKDIKKLLYDGTPLNDIAASIQHLEAAASTRLTVEERTVLLKHLEKKESRWKGPKRGLDAYNKRMRRFQLPEGDVSSIFVHQIRALFNKFKNGEILYSDAMRQVDELTKNRTDADKWRAALHSLRNVNEGQMDTIRLTQLRNLTANVNKAIETAYTYSDANDATGYYAALNSADKHIQAYVRKHGGFRLTEAKYSAGVKYRVTADGKVLHPYSEEERNSYKEGDFDSYEEAKLEADDVSANWVSIHEVKNGKVGKELYFDEAEDDYEDMIGSQYGDPF